MQHASLTAAVEARVADGRPGREYAGLSALYRSGAATPVATGAAEALAYAAVRAPATGAAITRVLAELARRRPGWSPDSLLDLGSGPGTGLWATAEAFPGLAEVTAVERSPAFAALGRELAEDAAASQVRAARWLSTGLPADPGTPLPRADLVLSAYLLVELDPRVAEQVVAQAWDAATDTLVLVEPGTPQGFSRILAARTWLLRAGAGLLAPCPTPAPCPLAAGPSWCHFAVRLPRTSVHRAAKRASLPFEDEKHCYVVATRTPMAADAPRLLAMPAVRKGHVLLRLCTAPTVTQQTVARSAGPDYRRARDLVWGDTAPRPPAPG